MSIDKIKKGMVCRNKKDGKRVKVEGSNGDKVIAVDLETFAKKEIAESTFKRWYEEVREDVVTADPTPAQEQPAETKGVELQFEAGADDGEGNNTPEPETKADDRADKKPKDSKKAETKKEAKEAKAETKPEPKPKAEKPAATKVTRIPKEVLPTIAQFGEELEAFAAGLGDDITLKDVSTYKGVYLGKRNICEIHVQKRKIKIHVNSESLDAKTKKLVKVVPETFGWTLDAIFNITNTDELAIAKKMLEAGRDYRLS